jgi:hypothetical protein
MNFCRNILDVSDKTWLKNRSGKNAIPSAGRKRIFAKAEQSIQNMPG